MIYVTNIHIKMSQIHEIKMTQKLQYIKNTKTRLL
jgi:hypothetical protein